MPDLATIRAAWDDAAQDDAMGAIMTVPDLDEQSFWESGRTEIERAIEHIDRLGITARRSALDFGCGIGRLSVPLADHYVTVVGLDVSGEMITRARAHDRVLYYRRNWLGGLVDFDLVYSNITLQHVPMDMQREYVRQFVRALSPQGVAVFEIPYGQTANGRYTAQTMYATPQRLVETWLRTFGAKVLDIVETDSAGPMLRSVRYVVGPSDRRATVTA